MIVVCDTSPVCYLLLVGEIEILPQLYGQVLIPETNYPYFASTTADDRAKSLTTKLAQPIACSKLYQTSNA